MEVQVVKREAGDGARYGVRVMRPCEVWYWGFWRNTFLRSEKEEMWGAFDRDELPHVIYNGLTYKDLRITWTKDKTRAERLALLISKMDMKPSVVFEGGGRTPDM